MTDTTEQSGDPVPEEVGAGEETGGKQFDPVPAAGIFALFALTVIGGLSLVDPFLASNVQAFENPSSLSNVGLIVVEVLVATAGFLVAFRYDLGEQVVKVFVLGAMVYLIAESLWILLPASVPAPTVVGAGIALVFGALLWVYPEWWLLDLAGVSFGAVAIALFGVSLSPLPVLALLVIMAAYDAYSVYVSEHMQSLGSGVVDLKLPMVFVVPATAGFSMRDVGDLEDLESSAMLLGVGDAMFPGLLAASAATFLDEAPTVFAGLNAPALGALVGALVGMVALEVMLFKIRRTHAGLPILNTCVLAGYLVGVLAAGIPIATAFGL